LNIEITDNKEKIIEYGREIAKAFPEEYPSEMLDGIRQICEEYISSRQEIDNMIYSAVYCNRIYGTTIEEYGMFGFKNKTHSEKMQYLTLTNRVKYLKYLNKSTDVFLLDDKYNAYRLLKPFYKRDAMLLSDENDYEDFCRFTDKHKSVFVKPVNLAFAEGAHRIIINKKTDISKVFNDLLTEARLLESKKVSRPVIHKLILEEEIIPSSEIAQFNPAEMSVLRVTTVFVNGKVHFFYPCFRIMCGNGDNKHGEAYSMDALVDAETGVVITDGINSLFESEYHPTTGVKIKGFAMPEWDKLKLMLNTAARIFPTIRYIGWDVVHTEKGWCIIEGNPGGECFYQMCVGHGLKEEFSRLIGYKD